MSEPTKSLYRLYSKGRITAWLFIYLFFDGTTHSFCLSICKKRGGKLLDFFVEKAKHQTFTSERFLILLFFYSLGGHN